MFVKFFSRIFILFLTVVILVACDSRAAQWRSSNMTDLSPRLQTMFEKTKAVCFGRFLVNIPSSAIVAWGEVDLPLGVSFYPGDIINVDELERKFIEKLNSEKAINHDHVPLLLSIDNVKEPDGKIITGYEDFEAVNGLQINGYFRLGNNGFVIESRPLMDRKDDVIADIHNMALRLRPRADEEVPSESGNCVEAAFLKDEKMTSKEPPAELVRIGFRLKEFPDVHLSIFIGPSNPHYSESNSLQWQLAELEKNLRAEDPNHPRLRTKYLRRGPRQIHEWSGGFEALSVTPELPDSHSIHDFAMDFRGTPSEPLKPYADIRMQTGVAGNESGATKSSLTDEEALAVWDKITSTIRVRPTSASAAPGTANSPVALPLGELAATGRICPQTGWWEDTDLAQIVGNRRRFFNAGERMPHVMLIGKSSLWQKIRDTQPRYRTATVWKLVAYDNPPAPAILMNSTVPPATD